MSVLKVPAGVQASLRELVSKLEWTDLDQRAVDTARVLADLDAWLARHLAQLGVGLFGIAVVLVPIGAFHDQVIGRLRHLRVAQQRQVSPAQVAGEQQAPLAAVLEDVQRHLRRAKDVPGFHQASGHARHGLERLVVIHGMEVHRHFGGIFLGVERLDGRLAGLQAFPVNIFRIRFLDMTGVHQHDVCQVSGGVRAVNRALVAVPDQVGQVAAVIDVGVREDQGIDLSRVERELAVALVGVVPAALEQAATNYTVGPDGIAEITLEPTTRTGEVHLRLPLAGRREELVTWDDYRRLAPQWRDEVANVRLHAATKERPIDRFQKERDRLRGLPAMPFDTDEILSVVVTPHARVHYDGNRYSVPPALVRKPVMLRANASEVRVLAQGQEVVRHERSYEKGQLIVHPEDRLAALKTRRRHQADQREEEFDALGPAAREFHLKLLSMPLKPTVHLRRLLALVRLYGRKEVLAAVSQALQYQTYDAAYVEALLLQERRRRELPSPTPLCPKRRELIEDIHLEEPDPGRYDRLCGDGGGQEPSDHQESSGQQEPPP